MYQYDDDDDDVHNEGAAILESKSSILMGSSEIWTSFFYHQRPQWKVNFILLKAEKDDIII